MRAHMPIVTLVLFVLPVVVPGLTAATANAEVITVCWDGSGDYLTIQEGIDAALDGDEVVVCDGIYTGAGNKNLDFGGKAITVRSANGPDDCIIDCQNDGRGFYFHSGETAAAAVHGFTVTNGNAERGGGIYCQEGSPTISGCTIRRNTTEGVAGGVYCGEGSPTISDCTIVGNTATVNGGGVGCGPGSPVISNCAIAENTAEQYFGGGVFCECGDLTLVDSTITGDVARYGGGICCLYGSAAISNCTVTGNTADEYGGGLHCYDNDAAITDCTIVENLSLGDGGAVYCGAGSPTISECRIVGNIAADAGGGIYCAYNTPRIVNCLITANTGAGDHCYGGGAIHWGSGSATISNCEIAANTAFNGGAISSCFGKDTVVNCVITANAAYDDGGAVFSSASDVTLTGCTLAVNAAGSRGGAVCSNWGSKTMIGNCILWADTALVGPEMALRDGSQVTVSYCDIQGGSSAADVGETCTLNWGPGNIDADPLFVNPENGHLRLALGSPCIDAGCNWAVPPDTADLDDDGDTNEYTPLDLGGKGRFFDDPYTADTGCGCPPIVDMGAYEFGWTGPQPCLGDLDCDRDVDESDLGILLAAWHSSAEGDLNCDGVTDHPDLGLLLAHWGDVCP
jgi:hypothetical protein